ncbi:MAG: mycothiol system anti-sigma-R factor [Nitriliruptoraceae bacterium]
MTATPRPDRPATTDDRVADGCSPSGCEEALAELEAYLDGQLDAERLTDIRAHLAACYPCTGRATFEEQLRAIVRRDCVDHAPDSLLDRIHAVLDDADTDAR